MTKCFSFVFVLTQLYSFFSLLVLTRFYNIEYGYEIIHTLVTDLNPDSKVKISMNEINASRRLKEAASHRAEADKTKQVKAAEAEAEARYLSGLGVARQRKAIVQGLQSSVAEFSDQVEGATPKDVMSVLLLTQYLVRILVVAVNKRSLTTRSSHTSLTEQISSCRIAGYIEYGRSQLSVFGARSSLCGNLGGVYFRIFAQAYWRWWFEQGIE